MIEWMLFAVGAFLGWRYAAHRAKIQEQESAVVEDTEPLVTTLMVEIHHEWFYLFDATTDCFIAQGKDATELMVNLVKRFGNTSKQAFFISQGDPQAIKTLNQQLDLVRFDHGS
jgi:hypothetical protein